jgi:hypothetical protein
MRGGYRANAGRKPGDLGQKGAIRTKLSSYTEMMERHAERMKACGILIPEHLEKLTPVDAMLMLMKIGVAEGDKDFALKAAKEVAPFCHPRLSYAMIDRDDTPNPGSLTDGQLADLISEAQKVLGMRSASDVEFEEVEAAAPARLTVDHPPTPTTSSRDSDPTAT